MTKRTMKELLEGAELSEDEQLNEAARRSLGRLMHHVKNHEIGILSASRSLSERSPKENEEHTNQLEHAIRSAGYSHVPVVGRYAEEHEGKKVPVKEKSFIVINHKGDGKLHEFLHKHASLHNQDSYIHKPAGSDRANLHAPVRDVDYLDLKKGEHKDIGTFHPNRVPEYSHTVLTRGGGKGSTKAAHKTFAFDTRSKRSKGDPDFPSVK